MNGQDKSKDGRFKKGNSGRKKGSKNAQPNQKAMNQLLNFITEDLTENYDTLTTNNKIRILQAFARKFDNDSIIQLDNLRFEFNS
jgi:hypothetical protein